MFTKYDGMLGWYNQNLEQTYEVIVKLKEARGQFGIVRLTVLAHDKITFS